MTKLVDDSRGRHALLALLDEKSQKDLEGESGVKHPTLSLIVIRERRPGRKTAGKLTKIGIEFAWWDLPPLASQLKRDATRKAEKESAA